MKISCIFIVVFILVSGSMQAQPYHNGAGIKAGYSSGLIFKHFISKHRAIEFQGLYNNHGFQFTGIYAFQFSPHPKDRLQYYTGAGIFGGNWEEEFSLGIALAGGAEYIFRDAPLSLGVEWKPMANLYRNPALAIPDIAITVSVKLN